MTENDWLLLSEWLDGTLGDEARATLEARFTTEPQLAQAARRLQALEAVAKAAAPTAADHTAWAPRRTSWPFGVLVALLLVAGAALLGRSSCAGSSSTIVDAGVAIAVRTETTLELDRFTPALPPGFDDAGRHTPVETALTMEPVAAPLHGTGKPIRGAPPMPLRADASVVVAASALLFAIAPARPDAGGFDAGAAIVDAGAPDAGLLRPTLRLRRGDRYLMGAAVTATQPAGVVRVSATGFVWSLEAMAVGSTVLRLDRDGGVSELEVTVVDEISQPHTVTLGVGVAKQILAPGRVRWSIGDAELVEVVERGPVLELRGKRAGATTLEAWFSEGEHRTWPVVVRAPSTELKLDVGRQRVLWISSGSTWKVTPPGLASGKVLGASLLLKGEVAGTGTLEFVDPSGTSKSVVIVVSGSDVTRATPARTLKWPEAGPVLHLTRGEVVALDPGAPFVGMHAESLNAVKQGGLVVVSSEQLGEGAIGVELPDGTILRLIVVVDP
ncbi:MAG: hypothetical protein GQE15_06345 [Archangiaceae bacterium]|nr:hypothetical protein [Archangiaceae bacterium]